MGLQFDRRIKTALVEKDSQPLTELGVYPSGFERVKIDLRGNSFISTVYVKSADPGATVTVNYFDFTLGGDVGEKHVLKSHPPQGTAQSTHRIIVSKIHDKPFAEITVAGGNVEYSVYITVVSSFASDMDASLVKEDELINFLLNTGQPLAGVVDSTGKWKFLRLDQSGNLLISTAVGVSGTEFYQGFIGNSIPGTEQTLINYTVPVGKILLLQRNIFNCYQPATLSIYEGSGIIGGGFTDSGSPKNDFPWTPDRPIIAGNVLTVKARIMSGRPIDGITNFLMGNLLNA